MKTIKYSLMSLFAMFVMMTFTSCEKEVQVEAVEYYIVFDNAETNMVDANGNSLAQAYYDAFVFDNGKKYQSLGSSTSEDEAMDAFNTSCSNIERQFEDAFAGLTLPDGWYLAYVLSLHAESPTGEKITTRRIVID